MNIDQFDQLKNIFLVAAKEVKNDEGLSNWLLDTGGWLISLGVELTNSQENDVSRL